MFYNLSYFQGYKNVNDFDLFLCIYLLQLKIYLHASILALEIYLIISLLFIK